jgi:aerotaxis receptor
MLQSQVDIIGYLQQYPFESCDGSLGYLSCRRKASREEIEAAEALYKTWQ